jgi:dTDP-4-dehydrorhamnose 3,5-epimerase
MLYFHTADYDKGLEGAVNALDPMIKISWPQPITECSERDKNQLMLTDDFKGIEV